MSFADGETSQDITVLVAGDTTVEDDEGFQVTLTSPTNAIFTDAIGVSTLNNDDSEFTIAPLDANKADR